MLVSSLGGIAKAALAPAAPQKSQKAEKAEARPEGAGSRSIQKAEKAAEKTAERAANAARAERKAERSEARDAARAERKAARAETRGAEKADRKAARADARDGARAERIAARAETRAERADVKFENRPADAPAAPAAASKKFDAPAAGKAVAKEEGAPGPQTTEYAQTAPAFLTMAAADRTDDLASARDRALRLQSALRMSHLLAEIDEKSAALALFVDRSADVAAAYKQADAAESAYFSRA